MNERFSGGCVVCFFPHPQTFNDFGRYWEQRPLVERPSRYFQLVDTCAEYLRPTAGAAAVTSATSRGKKQKEAKAVFRPADLATRIL